MHDGVEPDLLCCGKGASSGLPLALVLGRKAVMDLPEIGSMSSTHSANPIVCAAGLANLHALIDDGIIESARALSESFHARLRSIKERFPDQIRQVLGVGMIAGVLFVDPQGAPLTDLANRVCEATMRRGLLVVHTGRESIKLAPPLTINEEAMNEGLDVFENAIADCVGGTGSDSFYSAHGNRG
jgi:4-aminobutyrate aminotransferase-like enzyme